MLNELIQCFPDKKFFNRPARRILKWNISYKRNVKIRLYSWLFWALLLFIVTKTLLNGIWYFLILKVTWIVEIMWQCGTVFCFHFCLVLLLQNIVKFELWAIMETWNLLVVTMWSLQRIHKIEKSVIIFIHNMYDIKQQVQAEGLKLEFASIFFNTSGFYCKIITFCFITHAAMFWFYQLRNVIK